MVLLNQWSPCRGGVDLLLLEETIPVGAGVLCGTLSPGKWRRSRCRWFLEVDLSVVLGLKDSRWLLTEAVGCAVEVWNLWYVYEVFRCG